jgi:hypothetical protein
MTFLVAAVFVQLLLLSTPPPSHSSPTMPVVITWKSIEISTQKYRSSTAAPLLLGSLPHPLPQMQHSQTPHCTVLRVYGFAFNNWEGTFVCRRSQMQADNRKHLACGNVAERSGSSATAIRLVSVRRRSSQVLWPRVQQRNFCRFVRYHHAVLHAFPDFEFAVLQSVGGDNPASPRLDSRACTECYKNTLREARHVQA